MIEKMKNIVHRVVSHKHLCVAIGVLLLLLSWRHYQYHRDMSEMVQYFNALYPAALTLHRDHFLSDPSVLHVLWWEKTEQDIPGLTIHDLWILEDEENIVPSGYGIREIIHYYNRITLAQACYLVQQGERSERLRSVFMMAEKLYALYAPEKTISQAYEQLDTHQHKSYWQFEKILADVQRRDGDYFSTVVMPHEDKWSFPVSESTDEE